METTTKPTAGQLLEKSLKICDLIEMAHRKFEVIKESPYYEVFGTRGQRQDELIHMQMVILRLQKWFYATVQQARETHI